jgi:hypothetical protein
LRGGCVDVVLVWFTLTWRYWWIPGAVFWKSGWTTRAEVVAGGLQTALVGGDIAGGLQMSWSSASGLWLGLARSNFWRMLLEVSVAIFSGWYIAAFGRMTPRIPGMSLLF